MLKSILAFFAIVIGGMLYAHQCLQDGTFLKYADTHPEKKWVEPALYYVGHGYYLFQDLADASTFFIRVANRYPSGPYGDDAYFRYFQCLDESIGVSRQAMIDGYQDYLEKFPHGKHADLAQNRVDTYRT